MKRLLKDFNYIKIYLVMTITTSYHREGHKQNIRQLKKYRLIISTNMMKTKTKSLRIIMFRSQLRIIRLWLSKIWKLI